jgi:hypothetical protein
VSLQVPLVWLWLVLVLLAPVNLDADRSLNFCLVQHLCPSAVVEVFAHLVVRLVMALAAPQLL